MQATRERIRLACDISSHEVLVDKLTGETPDFFRSIDVQFELALFYGDTFIDDVSNILNVRLLVREIDNVVGAIVMDKTLAGPLTTITEANWDNDTAQQALITFTNVETGFSIGDSVTGDAGTDKFTRQSHGLANGDAVFFSATAMPTGLSAGTRYYVVNATTDDFKVSSTIGGSAVDFSTNGTAVTVQKVTRDSRQYQLAIVATTNDSPGREIVLGKSVITIREPGDGSGSAPAAGDPSYYTAAQSDARYVYKAGDTMTGLLQFSGTGHAGLKLNNLTTTQRDALTPSAGMLIYNTTDGRPEFRDAGAWTQFLKRSGDTITADLNFASGAGITLNAGATNGAMLQADGTRYIASLSIWPKTCTQGDIIYASSNNTFALLGKNATSTRYLSNTGSSNNPAWAQIDLTNGVTGVLPTANGGTGGGGAANRIAYWTGANAIGSRSTFTDNGATLTYGGIAAIQTAVNIGYIDPAPASTYATKGLSLGFDGNIEIGWIQSVRNNVGELRALQIQPLGGNTTFGTGVVNITAGGKLGIGGTPTNELAVRGDANSNRNVADLLNLDTTVSGTQGVGIAYYLARDSDATARAAAYVYAQKEQAWTATASTNDAKMIWQLAVDGSLTTRMSLSSGGVLDVSAGFTIGGAATSGNVLRGDGAKFVSAALLYTDVTGMTSKYIPFAGSDGKLTQDIYFNYNSTERRVAIGRFPDQVNAVLHVYDASARTTSYDGIWVTCGVTSSTNGINRTGIYVASQGNWSGTGSKAYGVYIAQVDGASENWTLYCQGVSNVFLGRGNVGIGGDVFGTNASHVLLFKNGTTTPSSSPADSVQLYAEDVASSSELKVRDEAGNVTTLSPHNFSQLGQPSEEMAWSFYSERCVGSKRRAINVDMLRVIRLLEQLTGEKLAIIRDI